MITREKIIAVYNSAPQVQNTVTTAIILTGDNLQNEFAIQDEFAIVEQEIDRLLYRNYHIGESGGFLWKIPPTYATHVKRLCSLYSPYWQVSHDAAGYLYFFWDE